MSGLAALVFRSLASGDLERATAMRDRVTPDAALLMRTVEAGVASGELRPVAPALAAGSMVGMVPFYLLFAPVAVQHWTQMTPEFVDRLASHAIGVFLDGVRA